MNVYLIRHAHAGDRGTGPGDAHRPLSPKGERRAAELAAMLAGSAVTRIVSSPATRCTQTVAPLAAALGLEVEERDELFEGGSPAAVRSLLDDHPAGDLVVCSHGDIIPELVERLAVDGTSVRGRGCEKGSIWLLERDGRRWVQARYVSKKATALTA